MRNQERFIRIVSGNYSIDFWGDQVVLEAIDAGNLLSTEEWQNIREQWKQFDSTVQERFAQIAGSMEQPTVPIFEMLLEMLVCETADVAEASLDSVHALVQSQKANAYKLQITGAIEKLEANNRVAERILKSLREKLNEN